MSERLARYSSREIRVQYFNGTGYVVRLEMFPHTTFHANGTPHVRQGSAILVGARQGLTGDCGFRFTGYRRPDTDPRGPVIP